MMRPKPCLWRRLRALVSVFVFFVFPGFPLSETFTNAVTTAESGLSASVGVVQVGHNTKTDQFLLSGSKLLQFRVGNLTATISRHEFSLAADQGALEFFSIGKGHIGGKT